jgi:hypothetical protein
MYLNLMYQNQENPIHFSFISSFSQFLQGLVLGSKFFKIKTKESLFSFLLKFNLYFYLSIFIQYYKSKIIFIIK